MMGMTTCDQEWPIPEVSTSMPFLNAGCYMGMQVT